MYGGDAVANVNADGTTTESEVHEGYGIADGDVRYTTVETEVYGGDVVGEGRTADKGEAQHVHMRVLLLC